MDRGRKMMEKWGWKHGEGLGKDGCGMTTPLNVRTDHGYAMVEQMSPVHQPQNPQRPTFQRLGPNQPQQFNSPGPFQQQPRFNNNPSQFAQRQPFGSNMQRQSQFGARFDDPSNTSRPSQFSIGGPENAPRQSRFSDMNEFGRPTSPIRVGVDQGVKRVDDNPNNDPPEKRLRRSKWDMGSAGEQLPRPENSVGPYAISKASAMAKSGRLPDMKGPDGRPGQERWSGENLPPPGTYKELLIPNDKKSYLPELFGPNMRFTSRFVELFDCEANISGWGTVIIRPRSAASKLDAGLTVIEEVLRQNDPVKLQELKQEYTMKPDAGRVVQNRQGAFDERRHFDATRNRQGFGDRPGQGLGDAPNDMRPPSDIFEMLNIDPHNLDLISKNLNELQLVSGALFGIAPNGNVCLQGNRTTVDKGKQSIRALIETGRVVTDFVKSCDSTSMPQPPTLPSIGQMPQPPILPGPGTVQSQVPEHIQKLQFGPGVTPPVPATPSVNPVNDVIMEAVIEVSVDKALAVQCMLAHIIKCSEAENCELSQEVVRNMKSVKAKGTRAALDKIRAIIQQLEQCGQSSILSDYLQGAMQPKPAADAPAPPPPTPPDFAAIPGLQLPNSAQQKAVQGLQAALSGVPGAPPPPSEPAPLPPAPASGIPGLENMDAIPGLGGLPWLGGLPLGNIPLPAVQTMVQPGFGLLGAPPI